MIFEESFRTLSFRHQTQVPKLQLVYKTMYTANISQNISCSNIKKSPWKKFPCSEGLVTLLVHKEVAASIGKWKETMFQCLLDYTSDKELYSAMCSSTGGQHNLLIMLWH